MNGVPIRLNGVDAPENGTRAGNAATAAMKRYLRGKTLTCKLNGERTYDRWVGVCFTEDGQDIGAVMIANGFALDCRRYSGGRYRSPIRLKYRLLRTPLTVATVDLSADWPEIHDELIALIEPTEMIS